MHGADVTFDAMEWPPGRGDASLPHGLAKSPVVHRASMPCATGHLTAPGGFAPGPEDLLDTPRSVQVLMATPSPLGAKVLGAPPAHSTVICGRCSGVRMRVGGPLPPAMRRHRISGSVTNSAAPAHYHFWVGAGTPCKIASLREPVEPEAGLSSERRT